MLTKTDFMKYLECPVGLWMEKHRPELLPEETPDVRRVLEMGREVDDFSRKLFPGGATVSGFNRQGWENTQRLMKGGEKILFQPTAVAGNIACRADILEKDKNGGSWIINEVKSATSVKKEYPYDIAFQRICFENAGVEISGTNLIHINNKYIRKGDVEPKKLFNSENITNEALEKMEEVKKLIPGALRVLERREEPDEKFLAQCQNPKTCEYMKYYLESLGETREETEFESSEDKTGIAEKLSVLKYPLYFLDYETYSAAIPPFDGTRPYQNIPFQYSLFIKKSPGAAVVYKEFLARKFENPVPELLSQMKSDIGPDGSVIVWNMSFEKGCNDEMARMEEDYAEFLRGVNGRIFDLMLIFKLKNQLYVRSEFQGSASLKKVLPVMCPELAYGSLAIQGGAEAMASWPVLTDPKTPESEKNKLAEDMLAYCKRDTEAMICILEKLKKDISEKNRHI